MNKLLTSKIEIIERKIRYNSTIVDHNCLLLEKQSQSIVLFHEVQYSFTMTANDTKLTIPKRELYNRILLERSSVQFIRMERYKRKVFRFLF